MEKFNTTYYPTQLDAIEAAKIYVAAEQEKSKQVVVLTPNTTTAHYVKKIFAKSDTKQACTNNVSSLGPTITTFNKWILDRWDLFGDNRISVNQYVRSFIIFRLLLDTIKQNEPLNTSVGTVFLFEDLAKNALPQITKAFSNIVRENLSAAQIEACEMLCRYSEWLKENGYIEISQMADLMISRSNALINSLPDTSIVLLGFDDLSISMEDFLSQALSNKATIRLFSQTGEIIASPKIKPKYFTPSGEQATAALILQTIYATQNKNENCQQELSVAVVSTDPHAYYKKLHKKLAKEGFVSKENTLTPILSTTLGRAFYALLKLFYTYNDVMTSEEIVVWASSFIMNSYSDVSLKNAQMLDAKWRAKRNITKEDIFEDIEKNCNENVNIKIFNEQQEQPQDTMVVPTFSLIKEMMKAGQLEIVLKILINNNSKAEQDIVSKNAESVISSMLKATEHLNISVLDLITFLKDYWNIANAVTIPGKYPESTKFNDHTDPKKVVYFYDAKNASYLEPESFDLVIMPDLTSENYPIMPSENSGTILLEALGYQVAQNSLAAARRAMSRIVTLAKIEHYYGKPLLDDEAKPTYSAIVLEELMQICDVDEEDDSQKISTAETEIYFNNSFENKAEVKQYRKKHIDDFDKYYHLDFTNNAHFSASAIETYLQCPYKWFVDRNLKIDGLDSGFGPLEKGSFAHEVLKNTYEEIKDKMGRIRQDNIESALEKLDFSFNIALESQKYMSSDKNPYIPQTIVEFAQTEELHESLCELIKRDVNFLPGFSPKHFEYKFGFEEPFEYAGLRICGIIDRIDVDAQGNAVVADYKGSLHSDYSICSTNLNFFIGAGESGVEIPSKVQALIYAQVVKKVLGYNVVGALYRSYAPGAGQRGKLSTCGAYDLAALSEAELDGAKVSKDAVPVVQKESSSNTKEKDAKSSNTDKDVVLLELNQISFAELVDETEQRICRVTESLRNAQIEPSPIDKNACSYCKVINCKYRVS